MYAIHPLMVIDACAKYGKPKSKQKIVMGWTWKHVINTVKTLRSKVNVVSGSWMYETHPGFEIHYIKLPKWEMKYLICELRIWKLAKNCELIFSRKICFFPVLSISFVRNSLFRSPLLNARFERSTWLTQKSHGFFKRTNADGCCTDSSDDKAVPTNSKKMKFHPVSVKTVSKWEKELHVNFELEKNYWKRFGCINRLQGLQRVCDASIYK